MASSTFSPSHDSLSLGPLFLHSTPSLRKFLVQALKAKKGLFSDEEISLAKEYSNSKDGESIPYYLLRLCSKTISEIEGEGGGNRVWLHEAVKGSGLVLCKPQVREKSEELKSRLARLQDAVDRKEYDELVKDVTKHERKLKEVAYLGTYREQLSFGFHVLVVMGTCFAFCFTVFSSQFPNNPVMHAAGGILGLITGMFVEVFLFIIRAARYDEENEKFHDKKTKQRSAYRRTGNSVGGSSFSGSTESWQSDVRPSRKLV